MAKTQKVETYTSEVKIRKLWVRPEKYHGQEKKYLVDHILCTKEMDSTIIKKEIIFNSKSKVLEYLVSVL